MRKQFGLFFILLFFLSTFSGISSNEATRRLCYSFEPEFVEGGLILRVEMEFQGNSSGQTKLFLPETWAGQERLYESIISFTCLTPSVELKETDKPFIKELVFPPDEWIRIEYRVKQHWSGPMEGRRFQKYWPIVDEDFFHFVGLVLFAYPDRFRLGLTDFEIRWKNFPEDWAVGNSFGCNEFQQKFTATLENFRRSVYVGGDYRINKVLIQDKPVFVALRGNVWKFSDEEFMVFIEKLVKAEREFWADHSFPYFFIALTPFGTGNRNKGGTGLYNSFDVFFYSDSDLNLDMKFLFSHELFHTWNTTKLGRRMNPDVLIYWFSEGFTDYYARLLLLRAGLIDLEEYVAHFNQKLVEYFQSPARNVSNSDVIEGYWSDEFIGRIPYQRGDILAHRWNALIKKHTDNSRSLDDFMLSLFRKAQKGPQVISNSLLREELSAVAGRDMEEEIQKYVDTGENIELKGDELGPCYERTAEKIPRFIPVGGMDTSAQKKCLGWFVIDRESF